MKSQGRTAIIVAGMHRSGTSVTTRIINLLGAELADNLIPPDIGNERGHWESSAVQALHNRMLAELDSGIYSPLSIPSSWFAGAAARQWIARMQALLADEYPKSGFFVIKDPRMSLFLPLWLEAMRSLSIAPRFVLPFRQPQAVATSLEERERKLESGDSLPHAQGIAVWLRYVLAVERFTRGHARSFVAFDKVLVDWRNEFARVGRQIGVEWPKWQRAESKIDDFLDVTIRRDAPADFTREAAAHSLDGICRSVYAALGQVVLEPQAMCPAFDTAAQALADAESILGPHVVAREHVFGDLRERTDAAAQRHDSERAEMHRRFADEISVRDARIAEASDHARTLQETISTLERERSKDTERTQALEQDRAEAHRRFAAEISARDARIAEASAHARTLQETISTLERERSKDAERTQALERDRAEAHRRFAAEISARDAHIAQAGAHARTMQETISTLERERSKDAFRTQGLEQSLAEAHHRFAAEISARDAHIAEASAHAKAMQETISMLERERGRDAERMQALEQDRAEAHGRFAAEISKRDAHLAQAGAHARTMQETISALERERGKDAERMQALEQDRAQAHRRFAAEISVRDARIAEANAHAKAMQETIATLEREHAVEAGRVQALELERAEAHRRFATEIGLQETRVTEASDYARRMEQAVEALQRERGEAADYSRSLEEDRDRAVEYAKSLERARDEVLELAPKRTETPVFFTIASRNYLAYAMTLMQSVAEHHPGAPRYLILADRENNDPVLVAAPFTTILAETLALPDFDAFAFRYNIMEFNTAIKPYAFAHLRRLHPQSGIVYLDPDILVLEPLTQVESAFADGALAVLTPHLLDPVDDNRQPGEREILASGTYNCGFVAIGAHAQADRLIAWWANRLEFGALSDVAAGLFTDQKWFDLVPGLFSDVHVLRDEGYNLAYWNLSQRRVSQREQRWYAGERPLVFVHFSGVDLENPERFSKHQNRHTQATIGDLQSLYVNYLERLAANGHAEHRRTPYAYGRFADGEPICDPVRVVYRAYFDKGAVQAQSSPFTMDRNLYDSACDELPARDDAPITRVMYAVWKMRADLQRAFDLGEAHGREGFLRWFAYCAEPAMGIPDRYFEPARRVLARKTHEVQEPLPEKPLSAPPVKTRSRWLNLIDWSYRFSIARRCYAIVPATLRNTIRRGLEPVAAAQALPMPEVHPEYPAGINLVGYAHGEFGVAEILRRFAHTLQGGGMPFLVRNFDVGVASRQSDRSMQEFLAKDCRYDVNLFCINADQMPVAHQHLGDAVFGGRYNIGCWFWELEKFPEQWHPSIDLVDEIWVTAPFVRDAIAACTSKPVHIVPVALTADPPVNSSRREVGLAEDAFVCLFSFDFNSFVTRKNAEGVIAAFRRAFADGRRDVRLVIKTTNGGRFPEALRKLIATAGGDDRIEVRDGFLDRKGMWALQACCDCYVSLHRSEGLGLGMAECMLLGKPVVATAYSGNLAFMDENNSCLVGYTLIPVEEGEYPAWQGQHWADPDVDQAAAHLKRLADDPAYARQLGERARVSVRERLSSAASLAAIEGRLAAIRSRRDGV